LYAMGNEIAISSVTGDDLQVINNFKGYEKRKQMR